MLRYPIHGFAKPVDDAVTRAMTILQARGEAAARKQQPASAAQQKNQTAGDKSQ